MRIHGLFFLLPFLFILFMSVDIVAQEDEVYLRVEGLLQVKGIDRYYKFYSPIRAEFKLEKNYEFPEFKFFEKVEGIEIDIEKLFIRGVVKPRLEKKFEFQQLLVHEIKRIPVKFYTQKLRIPKPEIQKRFSIPSFNEHPEKILIFRYEDKIPTVPVISILDKSLKIRNIENLKNIVDLNVESGYDMTKIIPEIRGTENHKSFKVLNSVNIFSDLKETGGSISTRKFSVLASEKGLNLERGAIFMDLPNSNYSTYGTENKISTILQNPFMNFHSSVCSNSIGYTNLSFPIQILNVRGNIGFSMSVGKGNFGLFPLFDFGFMDLNRFLGFKGIFEDDSYNFKIFGIYNDLKMFGYIGYSLLEKLPTFGSKLSYDFGYLTPYIGFDGNPEEIFVNFGLAAGPSTFGALNFLSKASLKTNGTVKGTDIKISMETGSSLGNIMINLKSFLILSKGDLNYGGGISIQF